VRTLLQTGTPSDGIDATSGDVDSTPTVSGRRRRQAGGRPASDRGGMAASERRRPRPLPRRRAAALTAQQRVERATEVRVEHVVDDRVQHRAAVRQPLEGDEHARRQVRTARLATRALNDVDGKERQVAGDEDGEQDSEHLHNHTPVQRTPA